MKFSVYLNRLVLSRSTLQERICSLWNFFFPYRVGPFQERLDMQQSEQEQVTNGASLCENGGKSTKHHGKIPI